MTEYKATDKAGIRAGAEAVDRAASQATQASEKLSREASELLTRPDTKSNSTDLNSGMLPNTSITHNSPEESNFDNPADHSEAACTTVKATHELAAETRKEFEKGIALADGLDQESIEKRFLQLHAKVDSEIPAETKKLWQDLNNKQELALRSLPAEKRKTFVELADKLSDAKGDRDTIKEEMQKLSPDAVAAQDKIDQLLQPYKKDIDSSNLYCSLLQQKVLTRVDYIRALNQFGAPEDKAKAAALFAETSAIATRGASPSEQTAQINALTAAANARF